MPGRSVITMVTFDTESNDCMRAHKVGTQGEHPRWAHLILQDYHALAPSVLRALSVKPRPARSVLGWILVELCTVLLMPVLLESDSWTGQWAGNRQVFTSWICITVDNSRTGRLAPVPELF